jgi:putative PIN family toxin of toxin-antitoxin system
VGEKKVVIDTNVLVSSLLKAESQAREIYRLVLRGKIELYTSEDLLKELRRVLEYPKLGIEKMQREAFFKSLLRVTTVVDPKQIVNVIKADPPDNKFLECAVEAEADYLITGDNKHLLPLKIFRRTRILNPPAFLRLYNVDT